MDNLLTKTKQWLSVQIEPHILGLFRIIFGLFMAYEMINYFQIDLVRNMYVLPALNLKYEFFEWVMPLPEWGMKVLIGVLLACSLCIAAGLFFTWSCRLFALGYLYIFLIDKSIYNNHIYLFILLAFLLSFTQADRIFTVRRNLQNDFLIPRWQIWILQLQIVIVYFYGGIAKLRYDWIVHGEPVRTLVNGHDASNAVYSFLQSEWGIGILVYGGLLLDILSPLLLWCKPIRNWGVAALIIFHATNANIFNDIGIFPYLMLGSLIIFYEVKELPRFRVFDRLIPSDSDTEVLTQISHNYTAPVAYRPILIGFFIFQLAFPFRGFLLPNAMDWTTMGNRFSWRMKVDARVIQDFRFTVRDGVTGQITPIQSQTFVNDMQIRNIASDPRSVKMFADYLVEEAKRNNVAEPEVYADIKVVYNGRGPISFVKEGVDLAHVSSSSFREITWINAGK